MKRKVFTKRKFVRVLLILLILSGISLTLYAKRVQGATYTWDGGGTTEDWSDCDNWSTNVCPTSADIALFNGTNTKNAKVDGSFAGSVLGVNVASGYTGTITMERSLTVGSSSYTQAAGTWDSVDQSIDLNGSFALSSGTFTAPSGTMTVAGSFTVSGGTFNHNNGTVTFDGSGARTLSCNNIDFNLVTINVIGMNGSSAFTISSNCILPLGPNPTLTFTGTSGTFYTVNINGELEGSGTLGLVLNSGNPSRTVNFQSNSLLTGFSGIIISGSSAVSTVLDGADLDFGSYTTVDLNGSLTLSNSAAFTAPSENMSLSGSLTINPGTTFDHNNGLLIFDGSSVVTCSEATNFPAIQVSGSGSFDLLSGCTAILVADHPTITNNIVINGGSLSVGSNTSLTVAGSFTLTSGDFTAPSTLFAIGGSYTQTSGNFTAPVGTISLAGSFTISGSSIFNANGGTVNFTPISTVTLSCNNIDFNNVAIDGGSNGGTFTVSSNCSLPLGDNPTVDYTDYAFGATTFFMNGTLSGTGTLTMTGSTFGTTINFGSTAQISGFTGFSIGGSATAFISNASSLDLEDFDPVNFDGNFTLESGTLTISEELTTFSRSFTISGGSFIQNNGIIEFDGSGTLSCPLETVLNLVLLSGSGTMSFSTGCTIILNANHPAITKAFSVSGGEIQMGSNVNLDLNSSFTLSSGIFNAPSGTMTISGAFTVSGGTFNHNNGTVTFDGSGSRTLSCGGVDFNLVTINATGMGGSSAFNINNTCDLPLGSNPTVNFTGSSGNLYTVNLDGILSGTGTLNLILDSGNPSRTLNFQDDATLSGFSGIYVNGSSGHVTITLTDVNLDFNGYSTVDLNGSLTLSGSTVFTAPSGTMNLSGNFTNSATFNSNGGTLWLDGTSTQTITGSNTFHNLNLTSGSARSVLFTAGTTQTVENQFTAKGASSGSRVTLNSTSNGSPWNLNVNGPEDVVYANIRDSNACGGHTLIAINSVNTSNNNCWSFVTAGAQNPTYIRQGVSFGPGVVITGN